ncbi:MAG TPA: class I SAM-dependent methyltransferase [Candidatus Saccharimonadales bacterium]|nr:class I SAM-dependent methyltransferase [Candidatus Saccharimonadales bacterium]
MKKRSLYLPMLCILTAGMFEIKGYNPYYYGNDPYASLQLWADWGMGEVFNKEDYVKYYSHYKHYVENISLIDISDIDLSKLPYPYNTLSQLVPFDHAGCYANFEYIAKLFASNSIVNALEIGSDRGLSTRHIASLLPENGKLYAVDVWDFTNESYYNNQRYIPFLSNVVQTGLTHKIFPIKELSQVAVETFKLLRLNFDLIYVDGDHQTAGVLRDLELYYPLLSSHGVMCGDDWLVKTTRVGIIQFAQKHNLTIYGACNFWFLKNEGSYQQKSFLEADASVWTF